MNQFQTKKIEFIFFLLGVGNIKKLNERQNKLKPNLTIYNKFLNVFE